jgi:hypothetical protein
MADTVLPLCYSNTKTEVKRREIELPFVDMKVAAAEALPALRMKRVQDLPDALI